MREKGINEKGLLQSFGLSYRLGSTGAADHFIRCDHSSFTTSSLPTYIDHSRAVVLIVAAGQTLSCVPGAEPRSFDGVTGHH
jgi:hypothetical protein